jgi:hypothetical protein
MSLPRMLCGEVLPLVAVEPIFSQRGDAILTTPKPAPKNVVETEAAIIARLLFWRGYMLAFFGPLVICVTLSWALVQIFGRTTTPSDALYAAFLILAPIVKAATCWSALGLSLAPAISIVRHRRATKKASHPAVREDGLA